MATATVKVRKNYKDNTISVEVDGVSGSVCTNITQAFESSMGLMQHQNPKQEFYESNSQTVDQ